MADQKHIEWCKKVRELLKKAGVDRNKELKSFPDYLEELKNHCPWAFKDYEEQFNKLGSDIETLSQSPKKNSSLISQRGDELVALKRKARALVDAQKELNACEIKLSNLEDSTHPEAAKLYSEFSGARSELLAGNSDEALVAIKQIEKAIPDAKKAIKATTKLALENAKAQTEAEKKRTQIIACLDYLRNNDGTHGDLETKLQKILNDTQLNASRGEWVKVWEVVKAIQLPSKNTLEEESKSVIGKLAEKSQSVADLNQLSEALKAKLSGIDFSPIAVEVRKVLMPYLKANVSERQKLEEPIKNQILLLKPKLVEVTNLEKTLKALETDLDLAIDIINEKGQPNSENALKLEEKVKQFKAQLKEKSLFTAMDSSKGLLDEAKDLQEIIRSSHKVFTDACDVKPTLLELQSLNQTLIKDSSALGDGQLKEAILSIAGIIEPRNMQQQATQTRDWLAMAGRVSRARSTVAELQLRIEAYKKFEPDRKKAHEELDKKMTEVRTEILSLQETFKQKGITDTALLETYTTERADIFKAWTRRLASATNADELDLASAVSSLNELLERVKASATPQGIDERKLQLDTEAQQAEFHKQSGLVNLKLKQLEPYELDALAAFEKRMESCRDVASKADTKAAWEQAVKELKAIDQAIGLEIKRHETALTGQRQKVTDEYNAVTTALDKLPPLMRKRFSTVIKGFEDEALALRTMGETVNASAMQKAVEELQKLKQRVDAAIKPANGPSAKVKSVDELIAESVPPNKLTPEAAQLERDKQLQAQQVGASLESVSLDLAAFKQRLAEAVKTFKKDNASAMARIKQWLKKLEGELPSLPPADSCAQLQQLNEALDTAEEALATMRNDLNLAAVEIKAIALYVKELSQSKGHELYVKSLATQLKDILALQKSATEPGKASSLLRRSKKLNEEITLAKTDSKLLTKLQDDLHKNNLAAKKLEMEWLSHYPSRSAWEERYLWKAMGAVEKSSGDEGLIKEIRNMVTRAIKSHKEGDLVGALKMIKLAEQRCKEVVIDPMGPALGHRKALQKIARQFGSDARTLNSLLEALPERADKAVPGLLSATKVQLTKLTKMVQQQIMPQAFAGYAAELETEGKTPSELREIRERAMDAARQQRALFTSHPLVQPLWQTPLNRAIPATLVRIQQHINRFEANVSRAVK